MKKYLKVIIIAICFLACGVMYSCRKTERIDLENVDVSTSETETIDETESFQNSETTVVPDQETTTEAEAESSIEQICVYVCGAVNSSGVYEIDPGDRIIDAIGCAGGFAEDADTDYLNLAEALWDGMKIYVPTVKEVSDGYAGKPEVPRTAPASKTGSERNITEKININTADIETLKQLKGVGDSRAEDIINYRENNGEFKKPEDIMLVPGIKNGMYEKIKDDIEV